MFEQLYQDKKQDSSISVRGVLPYLDLSGSGYNHYRKRRGKISKQSKRKIILKQKIYEIHQQSKEIYGAPKIYQELHKQGHKISQKTVSNYMREMGIKACYTKPYTVTTINPDLDSSLKNYLQRDYNPPAPNVVWCSDITYIPTDRGFVYLTSIMDLYSRRIIAWRLSATLEARWVVECIEEAKQKRRGAKPLIFHTDRGSQYVSRAYLNAIAGTKASYSQKASPWQNACIESFHALIKREWLNRFAIRDYKQAYGLVFEYIEAFYNTVSSHSHCDYLSPQQFEKAKDRNLADLEKYIA